MFILRRNVQVETIGAEPVYDANIATALGNAQALAKAKNGFVAPMPLLVEGFPHDTWYFANTEDISGKGEFQGTQGNWVVTLHGGLNGNGVLTPEIIQTARDMNSKKAGTGLNKVYAVRFSDVFGDKPVFGNLLQGGMPDGSTIPIVSWDQFAHEGSPVAEFNRYAIATPMDVAMQTQSGYNPVSRLYRVETQEGASLIIATDSQVIRYSGGQDKANVLLTRLVNDRKLANLGVWHPFNVKDFDKDEAQGRLAAVGSSDSNGLYGDSDLGVSGRFAVVAPEAQSRAILTASKTMEQILAEAGKSDELAPKQIQLMDTLLKQGGYSIYKG